MRERSNIRGGFCTAVLLACAFLFASGAAAQEWTTSLVDVHQGSPLSDKARGLGTGGYELQSGSWISFSRWYHASWIDMHVDFLTQI
ncbi:MAG: hypothetical protein E5V77_22065, partial [Mesorhizobium sp.]